MDILQVNDLTFRYPESETVVLDGVSLSVKAGEFLVICGESGCGKSTLLKLLKREIAPYGARSGDILYNGLSVFETDARTLAADIGFVLQDPDSQIVTDTVWHEYWSGLPCHFLMQGLKPPLLQLLHCRQLLYCLATREAHT